jgi:hypothetical protein
VLDRREACAQNSVARRTQETARKTRETKRAHPWVCVRAFDAVLLRQLFVHVAVDGAHAHRSLQRRGGFLPLGSERLAVAAPWARFVLRAAAQSARLESGRRGARGQVWMQPRRQPRACVRVQAAQCVAWQAGACTCSC